MNNPLAELKLDYWYKVVMAVCAIVFLLSGIGEMKAFPTAPTALISLGGFLIGLGEWVNHPLQTVVYPANAYFGRIMGEGHPRRPSALGTVFLVMGFISMGRGLYMLFW